jgi:hypothetical protein
MRWPTEHRRPVDCQLVMATAQVLNERVPSDHHARRSLGLQPAHRPEPGLQPAMVALDPVVLVLACVMPGGMNQVLDHLRQTPVPGQ